MFVLLKGSRLIQGEEKRSFDSRDMGVPLAYYRTFSNYCPSLNKTVLVCKMEEIIFTSNFTLE